MGSIDRNDAMIGNYSSVRKSMKWIREVVFHFIEEAVLNSLSFSIKSLERNVSYNLNYC